MQPAAQGVTNVELSEPDSAVKKEHTKSVDRGKADSESTISARVEKEESKHRELGVSWGATMSTTHGGAGNTLDDSETLGTGLGASVGTDGRSIELHTADLEGLLNDLGGDWKREIGSSSATETVQAIYDDADNAGWKGLNQE